MDQGKTVFRRINGRIVPIRAKKNSGMDGKKVAKGAGLLAAGVATEVAAGKLAAGAVRQAAHFENSARSFVKAYRANRAAATAGGQMAFDFAKGAAKNASTAARFSARAFHASRALKTIGIGVGGTLATLGLLEIHKGITGKEASVKGTVLAGTAATALGATAKFTVKRSFFRSLGASANQATRAAFMSALKAFRK